MKEKEGKSTDDQDDLKNTTKNLLNRHMVTRHMPKNKQDTTTRELHEAEN